MHYEVTREKTKTTIVVHADDPATAAHKGAIKLGVRYFGKKPTCVSDLHGRRDYYQTYCYSRRMGGAINCYDPVIVSEKKSMFYRVTWEIDVEAESPRGAAMQAMQMMPRDLVDQEDGATVFRVHPNQQSKNVVFIDLAEPENED